MNLLLLLLACGTNNDKSGASAVDTGAQHAADTDMPNEQEDTGQAGSTPPLLTYANFGEGFLIENCNACHAAAAQYRQTAAPEDVPPAEATFDTEAEVRASQALICAMAAGEEPLMPPEGGVSDLDRERLVIWLECGGRQ